MRKTTLSAILVYCLGLVLAGCGEQPPSAGGVDGQSLRGRLIVTGSSTVAPVVGEIGKRFETLHPGVRIDVQTGGSSRGIADARRGTADIGMVSRTLHAAENDLVGHRIALDGVAMIIHRENPVAALDDAQIVRIFTGQIANWREVGGSDAPITVVNKAEGRSTLELFLAHFKLKAPDIRAAVVIGDNQHGIRTVVGDPHAISYVSIGTAEYEITRGTAIRMLPMAGVMPSLATVRSGEYPLSRPLNLVTRGDLSPVTKAFIAYAMSSAVNDLVEAQYFVPIAE